MQSWIDGFSYRILFVICYFTYYTCQSRFCILYACVRFACTYLYIRFAVYTYIDCVALVIRSIILFQRRQRKLFSFFIIFFTVFWNRDVYDVVVDTADCINRFFPYILNRFVGYVARFVPRYTYYIYRF